MIENLNEYLKSIVIGIRFRVNFALEDKLGSMADSILYPKNSYFNPKLFPTVMTPPGGIMLINQQTNDHISINNSNIILELNFNGQKTFNDVPEIRDRYHQDILKGIIGKYKIMQINRIGYVNQYLITTDNFPNQIFIHKFGIWCLKFVQGLEFLKNSKRE